MPLCSSGKPPFEAIIERPEHCHSRVKPYLQYFEQLLQDLCIETNVEIHRKGRETILSIEPKDEEKALDKISEALQEQATQFGIQIKYHR